MKNFYHLLYIFIACLMITGCSQPSNEELIKQIEESLAQKDWKKSIELTNTFIERNPNHTQAYYLRALANSNLREKKNFDLMIKDLDKSIDLDSTNIEVRLLRFQTYFANHNFEKALYDIDKLIAIKGEVPYLLSWKGNTAFAAKKFKIAEAAYTKRLESSGQYEDLKNNYYYMVFSKYFGGNVEGAMWDVVFMESRGMKHDSSFQVAILNEEVQWEDVARFHIPQRSLEETEMLLNN